MRVLWVLVIVGALLTGCSKEGQAPTSAPTAATTSQETTKMDSALPTDVDAAADVTDLAIDRHVSVSGLSSGGYMAGQLHVAFSEQIDGAGIVAAGPYNCSEGSFQQALGLCAKGGEFDVAAMTASILAAAESSRIAGLDSLSNGRVWLFHGSKDDVVTKPVTDAAAALYLSVMDDPTHVVYVENVPATHGFPTLDQGVACDVMLAPYLNNCGYDAAGELLQHLTDTKADVADQATGVLRKFDQATGASVGLAKSGFVYTPTQCETDVDCGVHMALHGCAQSAQFVSDAFAKSAGYNRWADALDLIVVYPQVAVNPMTNPLSCWDWWGYNDPQFATRQGTQMNVLIDMIKLAGKGQL